QAVAELSQLLRGKYSPRNPREAQQWMVRYLGNDPSGAPTRTESIAKRLLKEDGVVLGDDTYCDRYNAVLGELHDCARQLVHEVAEAAAKQPFSQKAIKSVDGRRSGRG